MRWIEFFAGVGGFSEAWMKPPCPRRQVVVAVDIDRDAETVYRLNHSSHFECRAIESLSSDWLASWQAEAWWLSPPCQPFSRRGRQLHENDPRTAALLHLIAQFKILRPQAIAIENVIGFQSSSIFESFDEWLADQGYHRKVFDLCPTEFGWPNRRPRFYLIASKNELLTEVPIPAYSHRVRDFLDPTADRSLLLADEWIRQHWDGTDRLPLSEPDRVAACFGSSYGKAISRSGSILQCEDGWRRFSPKEILRLLGFPDSFQLPSMLSNRAGWRLAGNSLVLPVVRYVMAHLPD